MTLLSLRAGGMAVDLAPQAGGSIARFALEGVGDLLRPATDGALASGTGKDTACYPLVPFSNRIANGRLAFGDEVLRLRNNWPGVPHPMHGEGWAAAWQIVRQERDRAELLHLHEPCAGGTGWPFRYRACQTFTLNEDGLTVGMSVENLEDRSVPMGLGLHPFFVRDADTALACRLSGVWETDAEVLPMRHVPLPSGWDFSNSRRIEGLGLDHCFDGWDGKAAITWPRQGIRLFLSATEAFRHLVIYVPDGQEYFCVEPVSHANGAVGRNPLVAGATLAGEVSFRLSRI